uniref:Uncharacterized protein n=1 Tax=Anguilla anguilla TaxID=7936 RepID=A0A0E9T1I0_ANGAN
MTPHYESVWLIKSTVQKGFSSVLRVNNSSAMQEDYTGWIVTSCIVIWQPSVYFFCSLCLVLQRMKTKC